MCIYFAAIQRFQLKPQDPGDYTLKLDGCDLTDDDLIPDIVQGQLLCIVLNGAVSPMMSSPEGLSQQSCVSGVSPLEATKKVEMWQDEVLSSGELLSSVKFCNMFCSFPSEIYPVLNDRFQFSQRCFWGRYTPAKVFSVCPNRTGKK